ncbi:tetratricopeptide repeat protein [Sphingomonas sp.]|uniref:SPOR domain-containing protein n=1 Tax=Sphingomonas sp. TaxID=28214 RepID=UPI003AFF9EEC
MKTSKLALIGLAYGGIFVLGAAEAPRTAATPQIKAAAKQAGEASRALNRRDAVSAIDAAEQAVALAPRVVAYRLLLGQSYLQAGRFTSASQAFADVLALDGGNGKAALNLALTQVGSGDWQAARATLAAHADTIPASDRGLALALAGDTQGAVDLLTAVVRSPAATPKARQNLALSYALGGQWQAARVVAAVDMSPADVDARMQEWAAFAQPAAASDQVASMLGVRAVADAGQPAALALNAPTPTVPPVAVAAVEPAPVPVEVAAAPVVEAPAPAPQTVAQVTFGPRREVVQSLPAPLLASEAGPVKVALQAGFSGVRAGTLRAVRPAPRAASGQFFVQLGAFDNAGVAKDAWGRIKRRHAAFAGHMPQGMNFRLGQASFYRLSVGGFARGDADRACRSYKAQGGRCFVRAGAGDQVASWVRPGGTQVAMR